ncbi:MAG TPA: hypothetical protein VGV59_02685 [Pyrinomonadaceae bacterium]|nr:hypothetical protein [Pyrinomonadaceae bacterium]
MLRRFTLSALASAIFASAGLSSVIFAQATPTPSPQQTTTTTQNTDRQKETAKPAKFDPKNPTAEQIAETVIAVYGIRERLAQIRRTGVERGRITRINGEGVAEEITYERRFMRGETSDKDKIRLDQRKPSLEYSLVLNGGRVFGVVKGTTFTPRQDEVAEFLTQNHRGLDALLRYKENGSTVALAGRDKQKGIDMWLLDLTDKERRTTRYFVSSATGRVLWLEYEGAAQGGAPPVKYRRTFHDYRVVQGTRVPYRSVLYADGKQLEESQLLTVTYGIKMDDSLFQGSDTTASGY